MHNLNHIKGTDARNHIVRCACGWAYSSTLLECRQMAHNHLLENNEYKWNDPRRYAQKESPFSKLRRI